jgi:hypothetical protein
MVQKLLNIDFLKQKDIGQLRHILDIFANPSMNMRDQILNGFCL